MKKSFHKPCPYFLQRFPADVNKAPFSGACRHNMPVFSGDFLGSCLKRNFKREV